MARRPTGQLCRTKTKAGTTFGVRFRWEGKRRYRVVGYSADGMTKRAAEREIERLMAALWSGGWEPAEDERRRPEREAAEAETFDAFALEWYLRRATTGGRDGGGLSERGTEALCWQLDHVRAWFGGFALREITVEEVERFAYAKRDAGLSPTSVNKFLRVLRAVMKVAVRYGRIDRNPAEDVRLPQPRFKGSYLDRAEHVEALLDAAGEQDGGRRLRAGHGRALLATLALAGLRIDEALSLRWRDVDLAGGTLRVSRSKTEAGEREVDLLPLLRDELVGLKMRRDPEPDAYVFETGRGGKDSPSNVRNRVLRPAVEAADAALVEAGRDPLPDRLTPHSLRRTFASVLVGLGDDPAYVMAQIGHTHAGFTLSVYARAMRRRDGDRDALRALVGGRSGHAPGNNGLPAAPEPVVGRSV